MKTKITLQFILLLGVLQFLNAQTIITVDNAIGSEALFSDLQSAISSATAGDIIHILPSEINYGDVTLEKELTLLGFSHSDSEKKTILTNIRLGENASKSSISGIQLTRDIIIDNLSTRLTGLVIENCFFRQIYFGDAGVDDIILRGNIISTIGSSSRSFNNYTNAIITNNIIESIIYLNNHQSITIKNNIFFTPSTSNPVINYGSSTGTITVQNNIFYYNTRGIVDPNTNGVVFENCLAYNVGAGNVATLTGDNNLDNTNPLFVSEEDAVFNALTDDFHLQASSTAIDKGVSGEDIGIYDDGNFVFNNVGFTSGIPTVKIEAISNTVAPGATISVTISSNTH